MEDVISQGEDRPPRRARRRLLVAGAVVVLASLILVEHFPHSTPPRRHHPVVSGIQYGGGPALIRVRDEAPINSTGILGPTPPVPAGTHLLRGGAQPTWFWPATGTSEQIGGLPPDRFGYIFTRIPGGWSIQPDPPDNSTCSTCPGDPVPVYYLGDQAAAAIPVGLANVAAPAAAPGAVWLMTFPASAPLGSEPGVAREYSSAGTALGPPLRLPTGFTIDQGTVGGLLLAPMDADDPGEYTLWNPRTRQLIRTFSSVVATSPTQVAYSPPCDTTCTLFVVNLATRTTLSRPLPLNRTLSDAVFSPDGRYLALQLSFTEDGDDGALAAQLEVANLATGQLSVVPHTWVSSDALDTFGWPGNGDQLAAEFTFATRVQLAIWDPADGRLAVTSIGAGQRPTALIVG